MKNVSIKPLIGFKSDEKPAQTYEEAKSFVFDHKGSGELCWGLYFVDKRGHETHLFDTPTQDNAEAAKNLIESILKQSSNSATNHLFQILDDNSQDRLTLLLETHYQIVEHIIDMRSKPEAEQPENFVHGYEQGGTNWLMGKAMDLAIEFEKNHEHILWGIDQDFDDAVEKFMEEHQWLP